MKKPNILLLHGDQHRWDCLGCYGNPDVKTPYLDILASEGVRYEEHYTVFPVCTPSRYSMLSGQYVHQHTAWTNQSTLPHGVVTFPRLLKQNGYRTAAVGKMHFTPTYLDVGFDRMSLAEQNGDGRYEDDYHTWLKEKGLVDSLDLTDQVDEHRRKGSPDYYRHFGAFESDLPVEAHSTSWITQQAMDEINDWNSEGGNLLMVGYVKPHHPFDPPAPYSRMYDPAKLTLLEGYTTETPQVDYENYHGFFDSKTLTEEELRRVMALYYGTITQIDDGVGKLIAMLKEKGLYEDTMVIYTSDHGEYLGFHHMLLKGNFLYDPLAKIPLIVKYPKSMMQSGVNRCLCENIDLSSAILSVCGLEQPDAMCGIDISAPESGREFVFSEAQYLENGRPCQGYMIRTEEYKLLLRGAMEKGAMFFDLRKDPWELHNEIANPVYKETIEELRRQLVDQVLFTGSGANHCDQAAPQCANQEELNRRAEALQAFIPGNLHVF